MQIQTMIGDTFNCTPEFWAKISTIKIAEELNAYVTALGRELDIPFSRGSRQTQSLCWVKERVAVDASNATQAVILQPLKDSLQIVECTSSS